VVGFWKSKYSRDPKLETLSLACLRQCWLERLRFRPGRRSRLLSLGWQVGVEADASADSLISQKFVCGQSPDGRRMRIASDLYAIAMSANLRPPA